MESKIVNKRGLTTVYAKCSGELVLIIMGVKYRGGKEADKRLELYLKNKQKTVWNEVSSAPNFKIGEN